MNIIHPLTLVKRLEILACMAPMAMSCRLLVLIRAQEGRSGRAWA